MSKINYPIIGTKSSILWDEETDAWVYMSGEPVRDNDARSYYRAVPTLFRGVDIRANAIANLPWALMKGKTEFEVSGDYQNKTGLVSNMNTMLYLVEASLCLAGSAYWKREKNKAGFDKIRHLDPTSMVLDEKKAKNGIIEWKRNEPQPKTYTPKEVVYLWYPDPYVEIGPPSSWPVKSSLNACGVLANLDEFAKNYFGRGAIKAMLFSMQGATRETGKEFETWWQKFMTGINNAFRTKVLNAEKVEPVVVGEGIKELENVTLSQEKREEIALSLAIPMSILFANAANYATAERDKLNWYEDKVVPEANWIASVLNEQLFDELGLRLVFKPETLDIFQEDERERAEAMSWFMDAITKAKTFDMAKAMFIIYGMEVSDEAMALIESFYDDKEERADEMAQQLQNSGQPQNQPPEEQDAEERPLRGLDIRGLRKELSVWQRKCLSAMKRGDDPSEVPFVPVTIPKMNYDRILIGLQDARDEYEVKEVFAQAFTEDGGAEPPSEIETLRDQMETFQDRIEKLLSFAGYP